MRGRPRSEAPATLELPTAAHRLARGEDGPYVGWGMDARTIRNVSPLLIYDGNCGFCRGWIERWRRDTGPRVRYSPFQTPGLLRAYGISRAEAENAVQLIEPDGRRFRGAPAVFRVLRRTSSFWLRALARLGQLPGLNALAQVTYRWVAHHRSLASRLTTDRG